MAVPVNIQFDEGELQKLQQQIEDALAQELYDNVKQDNLKLQLAAITFLKQAKISQEAINNYNQLQKIQANLRQQMKNMVPIDIQIDSQYQETADYIRKNFIENQIFDDFFKAVMIFNDQILELITGAPMTTVIVVDGADGPEVREYTIKELLEVGSGISFITDYTSKSYALIGRIRINNNQLMKAATVISDKEQQEKNFNLINLNQAYTDAKIDYLNNKPWAFFKPDNGTVWFQIKIAGGLGDISEAYTSFFFLKKPPFKDPRWTNLTTYFEQGVANVDAVSGLYTADVVDEENKRNYAIKAASASLPGYAQMIKLAQQILNSTNQLTLEKLKQISYQKQYYANKTDQNGQPLRKGLRNKIEQVVNPIPTEWITNINLTI